MKKGKEKSPIIIEGHSLSEYYSKYIHAYLHANVEIIDNPKDLRSGKRYWKINNRYYQVNHAPLLKKIGLTIAGLSLITTIYLPIHFLVIATKERYHDYQFKYWNECESLNKLKGFVKDVTTEGGEYFVPREDRIATFDMDGTLFGERSPIYIEWMMYQDYLDSHPEIDRNTPVKYKIRDKDIEIEREVTLDFTYNEINEFKKDNEIKELEMDEAYCGAKVFANIPVLDYEEYVSNYLENDAEIFNNLQYKDMFYKPMIEVVEFLQLNNFDVYVVSGTDRFMVRTIVRKHLNIPWNKVIGMDVSLKYEDGTIIRGDELKYKNVKVVKAELIAQEIGNWPILSFGNSSGDIQMHEVALSNPYYKSLAFMNVADDRERERGYTPEQLEERIKNWGRFQLFSMKNDWKTIYGDNVTLKKPL